MSFFAIFVSKFSSLSSAFSNRNYAIYISGNSISLLGFWMQRLAVAWLTWEITRSEFWVGAVAFADLVPIIFVGPLFGVWADRFDRRKMAILAQALMMLQAFALFLLAVFDLLTIGLLFTLALLEGILHAAYQPIRLALIPNMVRKQDLVTAAAFTAVVFNVARFAGPALAGVIMSMSGPAWAILVNAITYGVTVVSWQFINIPAKAENKETRKSFLTDIRAGMQHVLDIPALMALFLLLTIIGLFARPLTFLLSAFVGAVYEEGPETLALFTSALGIGAVLAGLKLSMNGGTAGLVRSILINTLITIIALAGFACIEHKAIAALLLFVFGYSITVGSVASQTLIQNRVQDQMRGRVLSLWVAFTRGAPALGVLVIGWFSHLYGLMLPTLVSALLCLLGLLLMLGQRRRLRDYFEG